MESGVLSEVGVLILVKTEHLCHGCMVACARILTNLLHETETTRVCPCAQLMQKGFEAGFACSMSCRNVCERNTGLRSKALAGNWLHNG